MLEMHGLQLDIVTPSLWTSTLSMIAVYFLFLSYMQPLDCSHLLWQPVLACTLAVPDVLSVWFGG